MEVNVGRVDGGRAAIAADRRPAGMDMSIIELMLSAPPLTISSVTFNCSWSPGFSRSVGASAIGPPEG